MYDASDPRAALAPAAAATKVATEFAGADYAKFYETEPEESSAAAGSVS